MATSRPADITLRINSQEQEEIEPGLNRLGVILGSFGEAAGMGIADPASFEQEMVENAATPDAAKRLTDDMFATSPERMAESFMVASGAGAQVPEEIIKWLRRMSRSDKRAGGGQRPQMRGVSQQAIGDTFRSFEGAQKQFDAEYARKGLSPLPTKQEETARKQAFLLHNVGKWSAGEIMRLKETVKQELAAGVTDPPSLPRLLAQFQYHAQTFTGGRIKAAAEAGQKLGALGDNADIAAAHLDQFTALFKDPHRSGWDPYTLVSRLDALDTPEQIAHFAERSAIGKTGDALLEVWINSLLSGTATHVMNILDNAARIMVAAPVTRAYAGLMPWSEVSLRESWEMTRAMFHATTEAVAVVGKAYRSGHAGADPYTSVARGSKEVPRRKAITAENWKVSPDHGTLGWFADVTGNVIRTPGNALFAADEFFKVFAYRMEVAATAHREAIREGTAKGLRGDKLDSFVNHRRSEIIKDPSREAPMLHESAQKYATYMTLQDRLGMTAGLQDWINQHPMAKVVLPFYQTPVNAMKQQWEHMPVLGVLSSKFWREVHAGGVRRDMAIAKQAFGATILGGYAMLAQAGMITGSGPDDRDMAATVDYPRDSIYIGGKYHSYARWGVFGQVLGTIADYRMRVTGTETSDAEAQNMVGAIILAVTKHSGNPAFDMGLLELLRAATRPEQFKEHEIDKLVSTIIPTLAKQINDTMVDGVIRDVRNGILDGSFDPVKARIPGASKTLMPRLDIWGRERHIEKEWWDIVNPNKRQTRPHINDMAPLDRELWNNRIALQMPRFEVDGVEMEDAAVRHAFVKLANDDTLFGKPLREHLNELVQSPVYTGLQGKGPESLKADLIRDHIRAAYVDARVRLVESNRFPDFTRKVRLERERVQGLKQ